MKSEERSVENRIASAGDALRPPAHWKRQVWRRIRLGEEPMFIPERRSHAVSFAAVGAAVAMAAAMLMLVSVSKNNLKEAHKQQRIALAELAELAEMEEGIDRTLREVGLAQTRANAAFQDLKAAKARDLGAAREALAGAEHAALRRGPQPRKEAVAPAVKKRRRAKAKAKAKKASIASCATAGDPLCGL